MKSKAITVNDLTAILQEIGLPYTPLDYYPIGAYFETSDSTFDPNEEWGGTWVLETSGYVHVSGDASGTSSPSYPVSKANNNSGAGESDGGSTTHLHATNNHTLTINEVPAHRHGLAYYWGDGSGSQWGYRVTNGSNPNKWSGDDRCDARGGGGSHNHGNTTSTSTMQPYINVYRWHRTA